MGKEAIYLSTDHNGLYEKYGYEFLQMMKNFAGEEGRIYRKLLQKEGSETDGRNERGSRYKSVVIEAAKKDIDMSAICGFSCKHCFLGQWCGGCRSFFNCCSYGTLFDKGVCPNIGCCREKGLDGCYACDELPTCTKGFYANGKDGNAVKAQAIFTGMYGKEELYRVQDIMHRKYEFEKIQEVLGCEVDEALKRLEEFRRSE